MVRQLGDGARRSVESIFVPDHVTVDYWAYSAWRSAHRVCAAVMGTLSTQAMLMAVGVGSTRSLPAAAGLNWVLKDGLGKLGKLVATAGFGRSFDSDLKRFRFAASAMMVTCEFAEMFTPFFPGSFLTIASLSSAGKAIALSTALAVQPAINQSFSPSDNFAEITAKSQSQHVISDNVGLILAVLLTKQLQQLQQRQQTVSGGSSGSIAAAKVGKDLPLPSRMLGSKASSAAAAAAASPLTIVPVPRGGWVAYLQARWHTATRSPKHIPLLLFPMLATLELLCTYQELRSVHLRSFNLERAQIVAQHWVKTGGEVLSPAQVSKLEGLWLPEWLRPADQRPVLRIGGVGQLAEQMDVHVEDMVDARRFGGKYLVGSGPGTQKRKGSRGALRVTLEEDARSRDILMALLQGIYCHLDDNASTTTATATAATKGTLRTVTMAEREKVAGGRVNVVLKRGRIRANRNVGQLLRDLELAGWQTHRVMLSGTEKTRVRVLA